MRSAASERPARVLVQDSVIFQRVLCPGATPLACWPVQEQALAQWLPVAQTEAVRLRQVALELKPAQAMASAGWPDRPVAEK